jgi:hypothetical protein
MLSELLLAPDGQNEAAYEHGNQQHEQSNGVHRAVDRRAQQTETKEQQAQEPRPSHDENRQHATLAFLALTR